MVLKDYIREIPDFPKPGISFKDITPLLGDAAAFRALVKELARRYRAKRVQLLVSPEARGFILGGAVAVELKCGFAPMRKPGKLPYRTRSISYQLEYGTDSLSIHEDAVQPGMRVLFLDDVLATGGTAEAAARLITEMGGKLVGCAFLAELSFLRGRERLKNYPVLALMKFKK